MRARTVVRVFSFSSLRMAATAVTYCSGCGASSAEFPGGRGWLVHLGRCHAVEDAAPLLDQSACSSEEDGHSAAPADSSQDARDTEDEVVPAAMDLSTDDIGASSIEDSEFGDCLLGSPTDDALARLYRKYPTMSRGMLDEILQLLRLGPATAASGAKLLQRIDDLPGEILCGCVRISVCASVCLHLFVFYRCFLHARFLFVTP